jgi:hypothetical protein
LWRGEAVLNIFIGEDIWVLAAITRLMDGRHRVNCILEVLKALLLVITVLCNISWWSLLNQIFKGVVIVLLCTAEDWCSECWKLECLLLLGPSTNRNVGEYS